MIKPFPFLEFRNAEVLQYSKAVSDIFDANNPITLKIEPQLNAFKSKTIETDNLFIMRRDSDYSPEVQALDTLRDTNFKGIHQVIQGYLKHYDPAFRNAANHLNKNLKLYGSQITRLNYLAETTVIDSIIKDWEEKHELTDALVLLNLQDWSVELTNNNRDFNQIYIQRTQEYGARTKDKLTIKREELAQTYEALIANVNARNTIDDTGIYTKTIDEINALGDQFLTMLHNRQARGGKDEEEDPSED